MTTKSNILKSAIISASISAGIAVAYAFQPAKTPTELAEPQVDIVAKEYVFQGATSQLVCEDKAKTICSLIYTGKVKADQYDMYVQYALDDASVEFLDILNVVHFDKTINAYVDRYEIEKINAAIAKEGQ